MGIYRAEHPRAQFEAAATRRGAARGGGEFEHPPGEHSDEGPTSPKPASRSVRRALLTPEGKNGSLYRCGKST